MDNCPGKKVTNMYTLHSVLISSPYSVLKLPFFGVFCFFMLGLRRVFRVDTSQVYNGPAEFRFLNDVYPDREGQQKHRMSGRNNRRKFEAYPWHIFVSVSLEKLARRLLLLSL